MAESIIKLKKRAVKLGMDQDEARSAGRKALTDFIDRKESGEDKPVRAKAKAKAKGKRTTTRKTSSTRKRSTARKSATRKASTTRSKSERKPARSSKNENGDSGRTTIGTLKWKNYDKDLWNPREDSTVGIVFAELQAYKGDVEAVFDALKGEIKDHVNMKKRDGTKRSKADAENRLRYNINRVKFLFATKTGQHQAGENRVKYGTGPYATTRRVKPARKASTSRKAKTGTRKASASRKSRGTTRRRTTRRK